MMGRKRFQPKLMYAVTLEDLVPEDNFYRRLESILDLRFLYQECKAMYGTTGNPSIDPVVFFKLVLFGYFENIIFDRELVRRAADSLGVRLYLGFDIDEELPWHSTISRTRASMREDVFEKLFTRVVELCAKAGLIAGVHQSVDSTLVKANASLDSLEKKRPRLELREYMAEVKKGNTEESEDGEEKNGGDRGSGTVGGERLELKIGNVGTKKRGERCSNTEYVSRTDPESRIAKKPGTPTDLYYATHYSVDSKKKVITDVLTTCADVADSTSLLEIVERTRRRLERFGMRVKAVSADRHYCSGENLRALEGEEIEPFIPSQRYPNTTGGMQRDAFRYDKERDVYVCPQNNVLRYSYASKKSRVYSCPASICSMCPIKEQCTPGRKGRRVQHSMYAEEYERLQQRMSTSMGKEARRLRSTGPEPLFAEAKMYHGLSKFMPRGRAKAQKISFVIATVQNLKRIMSRRKLLKEAAEYLFDSFCIVVGVTSIEPFSRELCRAR